MGRDAMGPKKWTVQASRTVHADRWLDVRAERVVTGAGAVLDPFYVLHYADWVNVVALTPDDHLVMIRQYRHGAGEVCLEIPGGCVDAGDSDVVAAAARELLEETGYAAERLRVVVSLSPNPSTQTNKVHTVLAFDARRVQMPNLEPGEDITVEIMPVRKVLDDMQAGRVQQSMHVAGLALALAASGRVTIA